MDSLSCICIRFLDTLFSGAAERRLVAIDTARDLCVAGQVALSIERGQSAAIRHLYVHPAYRRRGIATMLVTTCERYAQGASAEALSLQLSACDRDGALPFYRSLGYVKVATYPDGDLTLAKILLPREATHG